MLTRVRPSRETGVEEAVSATITDLKKLRAALQAIRRTHVSWNFGESHAGAGGVAAPVLDDGGHIVAVISSVFPLNTVSDKQQRHIAKETLQISRQVSEHFRSVARGR